MASRSWIVRRLGRPNTLGSQSVISDCGFARTAAENFARDWVTLDDGESVDVIVRRSDSNIEQVFRVTAKSVMHYTAVEKDADA